MMKKTYIGVYATIALFIIVGTVAWFIYGIIADSDRGEVDAKNTFAYFAKAAIKISEKENFTEKAYKEKLVQLAEEIEMKAFVISNLDNKVLISWPKESEIISFSNNSFDMKPDGMFTKIFKAQIKVKTLQGHEKPLKITAALTSLKPSHIFVLSRSAFLIILTIFILTLLMLLLQSVLNSGQKVYADVSPVSTEPESDYSYSGYNESYTDYDNSYEDPYSYDEDNYADDEYSNDKYSNNKYSNDKYSATQDSERENTRVQETEYAPPQNHHEPKPYTPPITTSFDNSNEDYEKKTYTLEDLDDLNITKRYPYESEAEPSYEPEAAYEPEAESAQESEYENEPETEAEAESIDSVDDANPYAVYDEDYEVSAEENTVSQLSKHTGVNVESALKQNLEDELKRSASSERDMALLMVKLKDLTLESLVAKRIANLLYDVVKSKEMIFEYEEDGFAAIMYDKNLDAAMRDAENIYQNIQNILDEYDISEPIAIGISTRADRLIDADRMLEETRAAIERAIKSADEPIVAFRVNPKKYREFIAEN